MTSSPEDTQALRALIRGRVQGVGFRFFVEAQANALELEGFVATSATARR